jgi:2-polyprenyl-3-methyl-5-hydroxy-6-metoxy-1,4-benzoquinol methylase
MNEKTHAPRELVWTPELVARFWDWQSRDPDVYFAHKFGAGIADRVVPYVARAKSVLDFGCGSGAFMARLLRGDAKVAGCDVSPQSIEAARALNAAHPNFAGTGTAASFLAAGTKFDAIVATETIEHVYDAQLDEILETMRGLAAPGARFVFTTPNREDLSRSMVYCPVADVVFHRWQHVRSWSAESLDAYMRARGFRAVDIVETDLSVGRARYALHRVLSALRGAPPSRSHLVGVFATAG